MIFDILLFVIGFLSNMFLLPFRLFDFSVPDVFDEAITLAFDYIGYAHGLLPLVANPEIDGIAGSYGLLDLIGYALVFLGVWYTFKLAVKAVGSLPFVGKNFQGFHK